MRLPALTLRNDRLSISANAVERPARSRSMTCSTVCNWAGMPCQGGADDGNRIRAETRLPRPRSSSGSPMSLWFCLVCPMRRRVAVGPSWLLSGGCSRSQTGRRVRREASSHFPPSPRTPGCPTSKRRRDSARSRREKWRWLCQAALTFRAEAPRCAPCRFRLHVMKPPSFVVDSPQKMGIRFA